MTSNVGPATDILGEFEQVVRDFKLNANLTQNELQDFQFTKLEDVQKAMVDLQKKQSEDKRLRYMKRLEPFLETMSEYGKVIEVFVNASEILAFVWGPMKFILLTASNLSKAFSSLLDMFEYIGNQIPLLSSYQSLFSENAHMRSLLVMIFADILEFHKDGLRFFRQKLWKQLFDATWRGFASKIENLKETMKCHRRLIESRATLTEFEEIRNIRQITEANLRDSYKAQVARQREAVLRWLSPGPLESTYDHHRNARSGNADAGKWLIGRDDFQKCVVDSLTRTQMDEIRCLFISQDDGIARKDLSMISSITVTTEDNKCDIEAFANIWKVRIEEKFGVFTKDELDIPLVVTAKSQGMFIFAKCVLKELFIQPSRHDLLREWKADNFPNELDEVYQRIIRRVLGSGAESQPDVTTRLLAWISNSKRPLRWHEIQAAISIDLEESSINDENRRLVSDSKDICSSLVEVHFDQTIELVHPTLKK
ncbi:hypothetical protein ABKA04_007684 [Annulohypoxylon sp. FPYF3050]